MVKYIKRSDEMTFRSKHEYIQHEIKKMIKENDMQPGDRLPTEYELLEKYDVSRHTVRTALNHLEYQGYIYKEQGSGSFVSEKVDKKPKKEIGVITTYISDYIFPTIIRGIENELSNHGYSMILASTNNDHVLEKRALEMMQSRGVDGLIIEPTKSAFYNPNIGYYLKIKDLGIPMVMINATYEEIDIPMVSLDDYQAGYDLTEYLIKQGHTEIGTIMKVDDRQGKERLKGYINACFDYGITYEPEHVLVFNTENYNQIMGDPLKKLITSQDITGLVSYNDKVSIDLLECIWEAELMVPENISVVSHDNSVLSSMTKTKLTGVDHPKSNLGRLAAKKIVDYLEKDIKITSKLYRGKLVIKNSVKEI